MAVQPNPEHLFGGRVGHSTHLRLLAQHPAESGTGARGDQPFPRSGPLAEHANLSLDALLNAINEYDGKVYCHTVDTVEYCQDLFRHYGSGPNFQGGKITLCTYKQRMRSFLSPERWPGTWIAGFSGINSVGDRRHYLVYLMRVEQAFESQRDLWHALPEHVRRAKAAHLRRHGDVFQPSVGLRDPFSPRHYFAPRPDHVDCSESSWHSDPNHRPTRTRRPALLVGDPRFSFLWDQPTIHSSFTLHRSLIKRELPDLLCALNRA